MRQLYRSVLSPLERPDFIRAEARVADLEIHVGDGITNLVVGKELETWSARTAATRDSEKLQAWRLGRTTGLQPLTGGS